MGQSGEAQLLLLKRIVFFCKEEQSAVIIQRSLYAVCGLFWSKFKNDPFCIRERQKIQNLPEIYICSAKISWQIMVFSSSAFSTTATASYFGR